MHIVTNSPPEDKIEIHIPKRRCETCHGWKSYTGDDGRVYPCPDCGGTGTKPIYQPVEVAK